MNGPFRKGRGHEPADDNDGPTDNGVDAAPRRTLTLCLQALKALDLASLVPRESTILLSSAGDALQYAMNQGSDSPDEVPATLIRREFVKSLAANLESEILDALDHTDRDRHERLEEIRDALGSCATPATTSADLQPSPEDSSFVWLDPGLWHPDLRSPIERTDALVILAYTTYYMNLHEEELRGIDASGARFDDMCRVASHVDRVSAWRSTASIASELELDEAAVRRAFPDGDGTN